MKSSQLEINLFKVFLVLQQPHLRPYVTWDWVRDLHRQVENTLCKEITVRGISESRNFGDAEVCLNLPYKLSCTATRWRKGMVPAVTWQSADHISHVVSSLGPSTVQERCGQTGAGSVEGQQEKGGWSTCAARRGWGKPGKELASGRFSRQAWIKAWETQADLIAGPALSKRLK